MGSVISLKIGALSIDSGKNFSFFDHRPLFPPSSVRDWDYHYFDDNDKPVTYRQPALVATLNAVRNRLDLLGISQNFAEASIDAVVEFNRSFDQERHLPRSAIVDALCELDLTQPAPQVEIGRVSYAGDLARAITPKLDKSGGSSPAFVGDVVDGLHAWCVLRLLAEYPANLEIPVVWEFFDVAEGWTGPEYFNKPLSTDLRFLLVTEGSSDASILKQALTILKEGTADFFDFVDMDKGYPFTGTGNMRNFLKGLASIGFSRRTIAIFDNDTEGVETFRSCISIDLPPSARLMLLPDRPEFRSFSTIGPDGERRSDINGRAASIECYLDLHVSRLPARVRWMSYRPSLDCWQGALERKDDYVRAFMKRKNYSGYDFNGLRDVLDCLFTQCASLAEEERMKDENDSEFLE